MRTLLVAVGLFLYTAIAVVPVANLAAVEPAPPPAPPQVETKETLPPPPPAEVLNRITAAPAKPVIKTKQGYSVAVDRSQQILRVSVPKKDIWISPQVEARQTVEVVTADAPLQQTSTVLARPK